MLSCTEFKFYLSRFSLKTSPQTLLATASKCFHFYLKPKGKWKFKGKLKVNIVDKYGLNP